MSRLVVDLGESGQRANGGRVRALEQAFKWPRYVALELEHGQVVSFSAQSRSCGKAGCSECPHGPYAFAVIGSGSSKRRIYLGRLAEGSPLIPKPPAPRIRAGSKMSSRSRR